MWTGETDCEEDICGQQLVTDSVISQQRAGGGTRGTMPALQVLKILRHRHFLDKFHEKLEGATMEEDVKKRMVGARS